MQAIILAAGMGKRLGELTKNNTKCMLKVNGVTLIDRMLNQLSTLSLNRVIIVVGYKGDLLKKHIGNNYKNLNITFIENPIYDKTNNIYSLALTKELLKEDDTLLLESDLIFDSKLLHTIINNNYPNIALVAKYEAWMDGTVVTLDNNDNIVSFVPKKFFNYENIDTYYKTVNIYKFSKEFLKSFYIPFLNAYSVALGNNEYYEQVLRVITLLDRTELKAIKLPNRELWYEIDDIQDLDIAENLFAETSCKLKKYHQRYGGYWRFPYLKDFCYLVNPYFPPAKMLAEIKESAAKIITQYPSGMKVNSLLASKYFGVYQEYICVGNGATELIKSLTENITKKIGITYPTFEEYPNRNNSNNIVKYYTSADNDFHYSAKELINFFKDKDISYLLVINPDNPSGNFIPPKELISIIEWGAERNINIILDESFTDFTEDYKNNTFLNNTLLEKYKNLIVVKSISKSYGVPGLRLGVIASSNVNLINNIKKDVAIWNINSFAEFYMQIYSKYESDYQTACTQIIEERNRFYTELTKLKLLKVITSQANYFLCKVTNGMTSTELAETLLSKYNILIKDCSNKDGFNNQNYIRIAVRNKEDNDYLIECLKNI